jgi:hypothetical protein
MPGARLLSGLIAQSRNACRSTGSKLAGVSGPAATRASPTASIIWVSSVTSAGSPVSSRGPPGPYAATIVS